MYTVCVVRYLDLIATKRDIFQTRVPTGNSGVTMVDVFHGNMFVTDKTIVAMTAMNIGIVITKIFVVSATDFFG